MATAYCDQPAKLLVCASVSHEFRAIAGSALDPAVNEIWGEVICGLDPAAKLRLHYARLAQSADSWFKLVAALGARCCVECEMPTCWVAIDFDHDNLAVVRCCRECRPPYSVMGNAAGESLPGPEEALPEEEQVYSGDSDHLQFSSEAGSSLLFFIAVLNPMLFAGADPTVVVDFDAFDGHLDGAKALTDATPSVYEARLQWRRWHWGVSVLNGNQGLLSAYWVCLLACRGLSCTAPLMTLTLNWLAPNCGKQKKKQQLCWDSQLLTSTWSPITWNFMTQSGLKACASLQATRSTAVGHASGRACRRGETTRKKVLEILATTAQSLCSNHPWIWRW
jgi:hypothetical protein